MAIKQRHLRAAVLVLGTAAAVACNATAVATVDGHHANEHVLPRQPKRAPNEAKREEAYAPPSNRLRPFDDDPIRVAPGVWLPLPRQSPAGYWCVTFWVFGQ